MSNKIIQIVVWDNQLIGLDERGNVYVLDDNKNWKRIAGRNGVEHGVEQ